ncbi:MAG: hypothetical protein P1U87_08890 [Verrucomicrobiales bacterium]|nr:hypothetical protein [Verrucomicrobiales bacterium]
MERIELISFLILFGLLLPGKAAEPVDIGSRLELFLDASLVESKENLEFRMHSPVKVPRPNSPLPEKHYITVIRDENLFRAYWRGSDPAFSGKAESGGGGETVCYAESTDGHEWTFPELGLHEVAGTKANNVILAKMPKFLHNFVPFLDTLPGVPAAERYKALAGHPGTGNKQKLEEVAGRGLYAFVSEDGIHWTKKDEVIPYRKGWRHAFDSANVSFWSEAEQQYVCYFRTWLEPDPLRSVSRTTSKDFETWTAPVAMNPNFPGEHLYTTQTHPYFRAPHIYVALATRYVPGRGDDAGGQSSERNATDILLMSTRAGSETYDRLFPEAFIRPGLEEKQWGNRANYVALNVVPTGPNEMSIYHRSGDRYVLRTDGFVSVQAGSEPGELLTKPVQCYGSKLILNLSTSAVGSARVEIQNADGKAIPGLELENCQALFGDAIELMMKWKGDPDLSALAGKPIRLRFVLTECDLYSYRFAE